MDKLESAVKYYEKLFTIHNEDREFVMLGFNYFDWCLIEKICDNEI